ncbi:MAG: L-2-amino-thiazoline-4-carboxylic acid hydrolase [Myxococcales bacterium]|nr:L-2-amino-thiazoline-4-carboxylic acid hydrolase [Myxococcales bacterium]
MFSLLRYRLDINERIGAPILIRELGILGALSLGRRIRRRQKAGEPFVGFPEPLTDHDRLSREQIGPAIVLYTELRERVGQARALQITEEIVIEAACAFLHQTIGSLKRAELEALTPESVAEFSREKASKFFNATVEWQQLNGEAVHFHVVHCRFPPLCAEAGVPELAPVFCKGDARFFGTVEPDVELIRPTMIATGGTRCDFTLRFAGSSSRDG